MSVYLDTVAKERNPTNMFNLILFGPPGSGKGTQSEKLIAKYGFKHLSTGDLLRSEIARQTALGMEAKSIMDQGQLVPDAVVIGMISSAIEANPGVPGFLFDGFPRTTAQAAALDKLLAEHGSEIGVLIALQVPEEELIERMLNRANTSGRSDDADENVQRNRLAVYRRDTLPVSDHYAQFGKSLSIEGVGGIEEIFGRICQVIDERSSQAS